MPRPLPTAVAASLLLLAACHGGHPHTGAPVADGARVVALMHDATGASIGRATASEVAGGLRVTIDVHGLAPGDHGAHVHTVGQCDGPGFSTGGGHWNPAAKQHGSMNPAGPHQGDLPNLKVDASGRGTLAAVIAGATMAGLMDSDGASLVIHAAADDLMTDPAGNSGARLACGVFARGEG